MERESYPIWAWREEASLCDGCQLLLLIQTTLEQITMKSDSLGVPRQATEPRSSDHVKVR